jgi:predicted N-formylglutamate amidohydrolase
MVSGRRRDRFLVTCEHGGCRIPQRYRALFKDQEALLASHRGYDAGAIDMARSLARRLGARLVGATTSRLLVDLNRSVGHPHLFSEFTRTLPPAARQRILERNYHPYRARVEDLVARDVARGWRVVHVSAHSFTPQLDGITRRADVGLLYDPRRPGEAALCARWKRALGQGDPDLRIRRNYPYLGRGDGLTAHLRTVFAAHRYVGIELEVNQRIVRSGRSDWARLRALAGDCLCAAMGRERGQGVRP